jgi:hypothetical protein
MPQLLLVGPPVPVDANASRRLLPRCVIGCGYPIATNRADPTTRPNCPPRPDNRSAMLPPRQSSHKPIRPPVLHQLPQLLATLRIPMPPAKRIPRLLLRPELRRPRIRIPLIPRSRRRLRTRCLLQRLRIIHPQIRKPLQRPPDPTPVQIEPLPLELPTHKRHKVRIRSSILLPPTNAI